MPDYPEHPIVRVGPSRDLNVRKGTTLEWETEDPILRIDQLGYNIDTTILKLGDGTSRWSELISLNGSDTQGVAELIEALQIAIDEKADTSALSDEASTRSGTDQAIALALSNYATANDAAVGAKAPSASPTFTGTPIFSSTFRYASTTITSTTIVATTGTTIQSCDATSAAFNLTLPSTTTPNLLFIVKKVDSSSNSVTVVGTFDGATNLVLTNQYDYVVALSTTVAGSYRIVGGNLQLGGIRLAQAKVTTGGAFNIPGNGGVGVITAITNTSISVPNSNGRPVSLKYRGTAFQTIVGTGSLYLMLYETTSTPTLLTSHAEVLPNSLAAGLFVITFPVDEFDIGVVTTTRTFDLRGQVYSGGSGSASASFVNSATGPTVLKAVVE